MELCPFPHIANCAVRLNGWVDAGSMAGTDHNDSKRALLEHSRERSASVADGESAGFVVPLHWDGRVSTLFIVICVVLIFVEGERNISAGVDAQFDWIRGLFSSELQVRAERKNGTGSHKKRFAIKRCFRIDRFRSLHRFA